MPAAERVTRVARATRLTRAAVVAVAALLLVAVPACRREERKFSGPVYTNANAAGVRVDRDASGPLPAPGTRGPYEGNAWAMGEGQRLWSQMNCSGCHFHGGGGMGPPLMDNKWRYGADDASVFTTIVDGRPNGMPAYRGRLSDDQVWQLVSYVRSLSGRAPSQAESARDDHMAVRPGTVRTKPLPVEKEAVP
jgi:cytochrome c oxidase cbb3-type subunit 3